MASKFRRRPPARCAAAALAAAVFLAAHVAVAEIGVEGAGLVPDRQLSFEWTEGAKDIQNWFRTDYKPGALARVWVHNSAAKPVSLAAIELAGERYEPGAPIRGKPVVWFRLKPDPLGPGGFGQVEIRLRQRPANELQAVLEFDTGQRLPVPLRPRPPAIHIERVAFTRTGDAVIWCSARDGFAGRPALIVDGRRAPADQYLVLGPWQGALGLVYSPRRRLEYGSFHYFAIKDAHGLVDAAVVRVRDEFFPLGTYGYVTPREYAVNSLNLYASFGRLSKGSLDALWAYGLRAITPGDGSGFERRPAKDTLDHPAIWAYYLHDEPDCTDYFKATDLPHSLRVGTYGMEMVARERNVYRDEPRKLSYLVIDQTYKPANWFVYGPIPDVCATDRYPPPGRGIEAFATTETCRLACGPNMLVFIFRAYWHEQKDAPPDKRGRMLFAGEERIHIAWALAAGAQGLISYIHCTEPTGKGISHGVGEYPDAWHAIGQAYREVETISPVLATAWPVDGAASAPQGIYARALVSPLGMAVVLINVAGCRSTEADFIVKPARNVAVRCRVPPWLADAQVAEVGEGVFRVLKAKREGSLCTVTVPGIETTRLLLMAREPVMHRLAERFGAIRTARALSLLQGLQRDLAIQARRADLLRRIPARYAGFVAYAKVKGAYGVQRPKELWNPRGERYNGWAWYDPKGAEEHWAEWTFTAGAGEYYFIVAWQSMGRALRLTVSSAAGAKAADVTLPADGPTVRAVRLKLPSSGQWTVRMAAPPKSYAAARIAKAAFLVPTAKATLLPDVIIDAR